MNYFNQLINYLLGSRPQYQPRTYYGTIDTRIDESMKAANIKSAILEDRYGPDFLSFFYRKDIDRVIKKELMDILEYRSSPDFLAEDHWQKRHPYNFPGPFYTGESDSCGTGIVEAPFNILLDGNNMEFISRQPAGYTEMCCVMEAAAVEVLSSYSSNGNEHWTYMDCRHWWAERGRIACDLSESNFNDVKGARYVNYLNTTAENDLRKYCYFLENGVYPQRDDVALPEL